jgi:hypothetical protein
MKTYPNEHWAVMIRTPDDRDRDGQMVVFETEAEAQAFADTLEHPPYWLRRLRAVSANK